MKCLSYERQPMHIPQKVLVCDYESHDAASAYVCSMNVSELEKEDYSSKIN